MTDLGIPGVGDATLIASGGSALVYEAMSGTGERLAVKVLRGIRGTEVARRFDREQSAAERLGEHPNIIRIHHSGITAAGEPYLVMPLFPRGSLYDELERAGAFPVLKAVNDIVAAAEAIEFAHSRRVLHRDLKPANLLRGDDGGVIVTDFGIARVVDSGITSATVGAATPLYAAPELLADNDVSVQSEVYALGATLYTLLAGKPAFSDGDNLWATMHRIRTESVPPVHGVPAPVMRVIHQAMAKEPQARPASVALLRENLTTALSADDDWWPPGATAELQRPPTAALPTKAATRVLDQPPPAPAIGRPSPPVGPPPARDSSGMRILAALVGLVAVAGLAWWGTTQLLDTGSSRSPADTATNPPIDNSIPSPTTTQQEPGSTPEGTAEPVTPNPAPETGDSLVTFTGDHFTAYLPNDWTLDAADIEEPYGFRSMFRTDGMYLNIDTTPKEQREPGGEVAQSARDIAASINSASEVRTEEVEGLVMHSFTFRNREGVDSIDIFFEVDGDGYAVVAGSAADPASAFAIARQVALSIRSNPAQ